MNILFVSLGCDKNLVDTEVMLGLLKKAGHNITNDETEADIVVINTCCFIHDAKEESIQTILEMCELKKTANVKGVLVTGCLAQRYRDEILEEIPEVDVLIGTTGYDDIVQAVEQMAQGKISHIYKDINYLPNKHVTRVVTTGTYMAYLKIAEGCNKRCTYCVIPSIRGSYRSVPEEELIETAKELAAGGVKELILVAQETTLYGIDLYGEKSLPRLLRSLSQIEGIEWIRLLYCYPEEIDDALIEEMAVNPKVCHYIDMPIQHASDSILKRMGRRTNHAQLREMVGKLRSRIPDIVIRTTLITGFPGETKEDHEILMNFVDEMEFERLGVFTYSREEGTPAVAFSNQVEDDIAKERQEEILALQQEISYAFNLDMVGKTLDVIIEGYLYEENVYIGRSYMDAPNVDGYIFVSSQEEIVSGDMVRVKVTEANEYDLIGEIYNEFTE